MQTRLESGIETVLNTFSGMVVAWLLTMYVLPLWGYVVTTKAAIEITCVYTASSLIRSYIWRRWFNKKRR